MTTQDLEVAIRECITDICKAQYVGKLKIKEYPEGWLINIGMGVPEAPITIYTEIKDDEKLIKFIKTDLRNRRISPHDFGAISTTYFNNDTCLKRKCCDK